MELFPFEILTFIGSKLKIIDILALATSNRKFNLLFSETVVRDQLANYFCYSHGLSLLEFKEYEEMSLRERLKIAAKLGDERVVKGVACLVKQKPKSINRNFDMIPAPEGGHKNLPNLDFNYLMNLAKTQINDYFLELWDTIMYPELADYNCAMIVAVEQGNMKIIDILLSFGVNNYNTFAKIAAERGHIEVVKKMLDRGAGDYIHIIEKAAENGHIEIVKLLIGYEFIDYNIVMHAASRGGHQEIVELMISLGANEYERAMSFAATRYHNGLKDFIKSFRDKKR